MAKGNRIKRIGLLTGGGDCPGLNAVIRGVAKPAHDHGLTVLGIQDWSLEKQLNYTIKMYLEFWRRGEVF